MDPYKFKIGNVIVPQYRVWNFDIYLVVNNPEDGELYELVSMTEGHVKYYSSAWVDTDYYAI